MKAHLAAEACVRHVGKPQRSGRHTQAAGSEVCVRHVENVSSSHATLLTEGDGLAEIVCGIAYHGDEELEKCGRKEAWLCSSVGHARMKEGAVEPWCAHGAVCRGGSHSWDLRSDIVLHAVK